MHLHICNECMHFDGSKKCGRFVQQIMHRKKFILHINAYFRDDCIFENFCIFKHILYKSLLSQLFCLNFIVEIISSLRIVGK
jgi:hypothetical protein